MAWKISFDRKAEKQFAKLAPDAQLQIAAYLSQRVAVQSDPRKLGKALRGEKKGYWRYRVGDYRVICELRDEELLVLVLDLGHRREVYR
jgi:mRNA interferase RelE/StbE